MGMAVNQNVISGAIQRESTLPVEGGDDGLRIGIGYGWCLSPRFPATAATQSAGDTLEPGIRQASQRQASQRMTNHRRKRW